MRNFKVIPVVAGATASSLALVASTTLAQVQPTADITSAITAELDKSVPSVSIPPPVNRQPRDVGSAGPNKQGTSTALGGSRERHGR